MYTYYATRAPEYGSVYLKPERQADLRAIERWLPPIFVDANVPEVACGTEYWTQFIAPVLSNVLAIDAASETPNSAKDHLPQGRAQFAVDGLIAIMRGLQCPDSALRQQ